jgi:hypothetical protein
MSFSSSPSLSDQDVFVVNQLIKFGRRPWVHINITDANDTALMHHARRVAEHYLLGGMDVALRYHTKPLIKVCQPAYYKDSYADFNVLVTAEDMPLGLIQVVTGGCTKLSLYDMERSLHLMLMLWPQHRIKNVERIYLLNMGQIDALIERYTGQKRLIQQGALTVSFESALSAYQRLVSLLPVSERFERI